MPVSSDAALHLGLLSHAIALERWTDAEVRRIARLLDANERDILLHLARDGARLTPYQLARRRQLFLDLRRLNSKAYERLGRELTVSLQTLATYEAAFGGRLLEAMLPAGVLPARLPSPYDLRAVVLELPLVGSTFPRQISKLARARFRRIRSDVSYGLVQGETTQEIIRRVIAGRKLGKVQAEALVRTAVAHVSNRSRDLLYRDGASVLAGVEWVSTLDGRTTPTCRALDGQVFPIDSGPRPPAHYQCRSTTVPITKSWEELGLGGMGLPETRELLPPGVRLRPFVRDTRPVRKIPKGQRAGKIGQVSADVNYSAWLAAQPPSFQDAVLGPRRGAIFRANPGLHLSALMRDTYEPLTLAELAKVDGLILEDVGGIVGGSVTGPLTQREFELAMRRLRASGEFMKRADIVRGIGARTTAELAVMEEAILGERTEVVLSFDSADRLVGILRLGRSGGRIPSALLPDLAGGRLAHNHPRGTSFSFEDIVFASTHNLREIRAIGTNQLGQRHLYRASPGSGGWPTGDLLRTTVREEYTRIAGRFDREIEAHRLTPERADAHFWHVIWARVAKRLGFVYSRTRV